MTHTTHAAATARAFRRRRLERNLALVPLAASWIGLGWLKVAARPFSGAGEGTFFWMLGAVLLVSLGVLVFAAVRWRCPSCEASLWGQPRPTACRACGAHLQD